MTAPCVIQILVGSHYAWFPVVCSLTIDCPSTTDISTQVNGMLLALHLASERRKQKNLRRLDKVGALTDRQQNFLHVTNIFD